MIQIALLWLLLVCIVSLPSPVPTYFQLPFWLVEYKYLNQWTTELSSLILGVCICHISLAWNFALCPKIFNKHCVGVWDPVAAAMRQWWTLEVQTEARYFWLLERNMSSCWNCWTCEYYFLRDCILILYSILIF